jgi:hypothetical protein
MTTLSDRPTHRVYFVDDRGRRGSDLIEIGAAWPTKNGGGLNIRLPLTVPAGAYLTVTPIDWDKIDARRAETAGAPEARVQ